LELDRILADREMRDCLLMVFANKQDLPGCEFFDHCLERAGGLPFFRRHCLSGGPGHGWGSRGRDILGEQGEWQVAGVKDEVKDDPPWG